MSVNTQAIVEKVNAAFAAGSTEGFLACCADDGAWTIHTLTAASTTSEAIRSSHDVLLSYKPR
jgi:hypothetical protein